jgi:hypothetical protein
MQLTPEILGAMLAGEQAGASAGTGVATDSAPVGATSAAAVAGPVGAGIVAPTSMSAAQSSATLPSSVLAQASTGSSPQSQAQAQSLLNQMPVRFEANEGQFGAQTQFVAQAPGYSMYLGTTSATLVASASNSSSTGSTDPAATSDSTTTSAAVNFQMVGANASAQATRLNPLATTTNYFTGSNPSQWHTNVPNYGSVQYSNVYQGINEVYYNNQGNVEQNYVVAPGANPNQIVTQINGASSLALDAQGNLVIHTALGDLTEQAPVSYQVINGVRQEVSSQFVLEGNNEVAIRVGAYDPSHALIIDPTYTYAYENYLGGLGNDGGEGIALDSTGAAYITGYTSVDPNSLSFWQPSGVKTTQFGTTNNTNSHVFVAKVSSDGKSLQYITYLAGKGAEIGMGIAMDGSNNAWITGYTSSSNFPTSAPTQKNIGGGDFDAFVSELDPTGAKLIFSTYLGGSGDDYASGIAFDGNYQNVYVVGSTKSYTGFATNPPKGLQKLGPNGGAGLDVFVAGFTAAHALNYLAELGGNGNDYGNSIVIDTDGIINITGTTFSSNKTFPTKGEAGGNPFQTDLATGSTSAAFVAKIHPGNLGALDLDASTYFGGSGFTDGQGIAFDPSNDQVYIVGSTTSDSSKGFGNGTNLTPTSVMGKVVAGHSDVFVARFDSTNLDPAASPYFIYLAGSGTQDGKGIALAPGNNPAIWITGSTTSNDTKNGGFPTVNKIQTFRGSKAAFVAELDSTAPKATAPLFNTYVGGAGSNEGKAIAVYSPAGTAYITGNTNSRRFFIPGVKNFFQSVYGGGTSDAFAVHIIPTGVGVAGPKAQAQANTIIPDGVLFTFTETATTYDGSMPTFYLDGAPDGASIDPSTGVFNWTPSGSQIGTYTFGIEAEDAEDRMDEQWVSLTVVPQLTTLSVASSQQTSTVNQNVTFTATVDPEISGTPTGIATFFDGNTELGTASFTVVNGQDQASLTTSALTLGPNAITAVYSGDSTFAPSSAALNQMVQQRSTQLFLQSSANPSVQGNPVTFTAVASMEYGTPTGTVTFYDGTTELGTGTLAVVGGQDEATFTTSTLAAGSHTITAIYGGDSTFAATSTAMNQAVGAPSGTSSGTTVTSSASFVLPGVPVTFTAVVSGSGGTPTGSVTFYDGTTVLGTGTLANVNGQDEATLTTSSLILGAHGITAIYSGDSTFDASSGSLTQQVQQGETGTTVTSSASNSVPGQSVTFTATVNSGSGTPTGIVTFYDGTTVLGTGTLAQVNGQDQATFTTSNLALGDHAITAVYGGDDTFAPSAGAGLTQTVSQTATLTTLDTSDLDPTSSDSVTFTATVTPTLGTGTPTGTATFEDSGTVLGMGTLTSGPNGDQASYTVSSLAVGMHDITAVYGGDPNFSTSTSDDIIQTINF